MYIYICLYELKIEHVFKCTKEKNIIHFHQYIPIYKLVQETSNDSFLFYLKYLSELLSLQNKTMFKILCMPDFHILFHNF